MAVRSSRVNEQNLLELILVNETVARQAKEWVDKEYPDLILHSSTSTSFLFALAKESVIEVAERTVQQSLETVRTRVDQFGVAEPILHRVGQNRLSLQMPGVNDAEKVKRIVGKVARLEFRQALDGAVGGIVRKRRSGESVRLSDDVLMTGDVVENAQLSLGSGQVEVLLQFTPEGGRMFRDITKELVGKRLAIVLDDIVYSDPVIREVIGGGTASISGGFQVEEAQQLAVVLKAGALPASLEVLEERIVGPSLGAESIRKGIAAIVISLLAVALFMIIYYKKSGFVAVGCLVLNVILVLACLSFFGATLTLPGLAGLALTVGMAVDSSIIIFERIRDELINGRARDVAVSAGFDKASSAIIDANVTGLISGLILYFIGTGPIRGFAVTTTIGMVSTLFCAVFVARIAFDTFSLRGRDGLSI
jgi:preprotein translocase subunit SecD